MIGEIKKVKILIVEDEVILSQDIANRLSIMGYDVVDTANTVDMALQRIVENPDLDIILIDIVLIGDKDGIELARIINRDYGLPFIFLSSHTDRHVTERAKSVHPYAHILKPFNDRQVSVAIELALVNFSKKTPKREVLEIKESPASDNQVLHINDSLFLKKDNHFERVLLKEILFLKADSNYTTIHTQCGRFIYSTVLKKIESSLPIDIFLRVHRSYLININCITGFGGNQLFIGEVKIPVSKIHKENVFNLFKKI